jgi:hypothetical protein
VKFRRFFVRDKTAESRPLTPEELEAFDEVFTRMDDTFKAMDSFWNKVRRG